MSRESLILILGFIILITPFLGLPRGWKDFLLMIVGAGVMILSFLLRRSSFLRSIENGQGERSDETFREPINVENNNISDSAEVNETI